MNKYNTLWAYIRESGKPQLSLPFDESGKPQLSLTFDKIGRIAGVPPDHSFLQYKKELQRYGYEIVKISMKAQTVLFVRRKEDL